MADAADSKLYEEVLVRAKCRDALIDKGFAKSRPRFSRLDLAKLRNFQPLLTPRVCRDVARLSCARLVCRHYLEMKNESSCLGVKSVETLLCTV